MAEEFIRTHRWASRTPEEQIPALVAYLESTHFASDPSPMEVLVQSDPEFWGTGPQCQAALLLGIEYDKVRKSNDG